MALPVFAILVVALLGVDEKGVVFSDGEGVVSRMPRPHLKLATHLQLTILILLIWRRRGLVVSSWVYQLFALVGFVLSDVFASLVKKLDIELTVCLVFDVDNVKVGVVGPRQQHRRVRTNL